MSVMVGQHRVYHEREARGFQVLRAGVQGPNVAPPGVVQRILLRQELPDHPPSMLRPGVQGPNVGQITAIAQTIMVRQQMPDHPRSWFYPAPPPVFRQQPFVRPIIVRQQLPDHPRSMFHAGTPPVSYEDVQIFILH